MRKPSTALRQIAPYLNLGGIMAGCVAIGALFGHWLDGRLGTRPWILLGGSLFGIGSGFYHFFKVVLKAPEKNTEEEDKHDD